jgi:hypothetical protein
MSNISTEADNLLHTNMHIDTIIRSIFLKVFL